AAGHEAPRRVGDRRAGVQARQYTDLPIAVEFQRANRQRQTRSNLSGEPVRVVIETRRLAVGRKQRVRMLCIGRRSEELQAAYRSEIELKILVLKDLVADEWRYHSADPIDLFVGVQRDENTRIHAAEQPPGGVVPVCPRYPRPHHTDSCNQSKKHKSDQRSFHLPPPQRSMTCKQVRTRFCALPFTGAHCQYVARAILARTIVS